MQQDFWDATLAPEVACNRRSPEKISSGAHARLEQSARRSSGRLYAVQHTPERRQVIEPWLPIGIDSGLASRRRSRGSVGLPLRPMVIVIGALVIISALMGPLDPHAAQSLVGVAALELIIQPQNSDLMRSAKRAASDGHARIIGKRTSPDRKSAPEIRLSAGPVRRAPTGGTGIEVERDDGATRQPVVAAGCVNMALPRSECHDRPASCDTEPPSQEPAMPMHVVPPVFNRRSFAAVQAVCQSRHDARATDYSGWSQPTQGTPILRSTRVLERRRGKTTRHNTRPTALRCTDNQCDAARR